MHQMRGIARTQPGARAVAEAIRCRGLTKRFGSTLAVDRLDLSVRRGEVFGFLGPNGAGKTTTLRMLLGLVRPTAGSAWLNGSALPDPKGLASVGAMVEEPPFYPWLSGRENLLVLAGVGAPVPAAAIDDALERCGIATVAARKVTTYSQGMRQRLGLAASLMRRPRLLLLDEPTNGLDPAGIREFRLLLRALADEGTTILLSSHQLSEVERICDRVAVVDGGRLVAVGTLDELGGARPLVRIEVGPADEPAALQRLRTLHPHRVGEGVIRVAASSGAAVNRFLAEGGIYAESVSAARPGLEELFMSLTTGEGHDAPVGE
jgi:ABC-2 type transport system ATP-binding protein